MNNQINLFKVDLFNYESFENHCTDCGKFFADSDLIEINSNYYWLDCVKQFEFDYCGNYFDDLQDINGEKVCNNCLNDNFYRCYDCGNYFNEDEIEFLLFCLGNIRLPIRLPNKT